MIYKRDIARAAAVMLATNGTAAAAEIRARHHASQLEKSGARDAAYTWLQIAEELQRFKELQLPQPECAESAA